MHCKCRGIVQPVEYSTVQTYLSSLTLMTASSRGTTSAAFTVSVCPSSLLSRLGYLLLGTIDAILASKSMNSMTSMLIVHVHVQVMLS